MVGISSGELKTIGLEVSERKKYVATILSKRTEIAELDREFCVHTAKNMNAWKNIEIGM